MEIRKLSSIKKIEKKKWNSFIECNGGTVFHSYEWLESYESIDFFKIIPSHFVLLEKDNIVGVIPLFITTDCPRMEAMQNLLVEVPTTLKMPFLLSHSLYAFYGFPIVKNDDSLLLEILLEQLESVAQKEKCDVFGLINIPENKTGILLRLKTKGFNLSYLSSDESIEVKWLSYKEYLKSLPAKSKTHIIKREGVYKAQGYIFKVLNSSEINYQTFYDMVKTILKNHNHKNIELFPISYIRAIIEAFDEKIFFVGIYNSKNECVSLNMCLAFKDTITVWIAGIDYKKINKISYHFFYGWIVKYAIEHGFKYVDLGRGTYDLKQQYGYKRTRLLFASKTLYPQLQSELVRWTSDYENVSLARYAKTVEPKNLNEIPLFKGASLLLKFKNMFIYGIKRIENNSIVLTGIGGKVEMGETFAECAKREALEEIGRKPKLFFNEKTICLNAIADETYLASVEENPLLEVTRIAEGYGNKLVIKVFAGEIEKEPVISDDEFTYLLGLDITTMKNLKSGYDVSLLKAVESGTQIFSKADTSGILSFNIKFTDAPQIYIDKLSTDILSF